MTYREILLSVDKVGGYMTDPIGKCLRTTCGQEKTRIDLLYLQSATYQAFLSSDPLAPRFDRSRAEKAVLRWIERPAAGVMFPDFPILVDRASGIIEQTHKDGSKAYGCLSDVQGCVHFVG